MINKLMEHRYVNEMIEKLGSKTLVVAMEEMAELQQQTSKLYRGKGDSEKLSEEIADVLIGIALIMKQGNVSEDKIVDWIVYKLERTHSRLQRGEF